MLREILAWLFDKLLWLLRWYFDRVATSWQREIRRLGNRDNKWVWVGLCFFFALFLLPYLAKDAFTSGVLLGLSFLWASFLAISFGYILRSPLLLILVYVVVVFRGQITGLFITAKDSIISGDIIGAAILIFLGIFLTIWVNRIGKGEVQ